jgi:hypothetical protein
MAEQQAQAKMVSAEYAGIEDEMSVLRKKAEFIEELDSKIDVASVIAEISFLIDERVVLRKLEFVAEKFINEKESKKSPGAGTVVKVVQSDRSNKKELPLGSVRFKVLMSGIAADTNDVAALMCKLEDSPYFCQVVLSYSRGNDEIGIGNTSSSRTVTNVEQGLENNGNLVRDAGVQGKIQVNEFEINCYLANYCQM